MDNARKHGARRMQMVTRRGRGGRGVEVEVSDDGHGIDEDRVDASRIFEKGYTSSQGGTGLGLYHARKVMEEMGGGLGLDLLAGFALALRPLGRRGHLFVLIVAAGALAFDARPEAAAPPPPTAREAAPEPEVPDFLSGMESDDDEAEAVGAPNFDDIFGGDNELPALDDMGADTGEDTQPAASAEQNPMDWLSGLADEDEEDELDFDALGELEGAGAGDDEGDPMDWLAGLAGDDDDEPPDEKDPPLLDDDRVLRGIVASNSR